MVEEVTAVKTYLTCCVAIGTAVRKNDEIFALLELCPSGGCVGVNVKVSRCLLAIGQPVAAVCAVIYSDNSAVLVKNNCYAVAVGGELTLVSLGEYPDCLGCSGVGGDGLIESPFAKLCGVVLCTDLNGHLGGSIFNAGNVELLVEEITAVKTDLTSLVAIGTAVRKYYEVLALLELCPSGGCVGVNVKVSRCLLAIGEPVAAVCAVVYSDNSAVLVENNCYAVAVGGEFTGVILGEYPNCLVCCGCGGDSFVDSPLACNCFKFLRANGQEHRTFVTGALGGASCLCTFCIGATAAVFTNAFALVACALFSANCFCALCILAFAAGSANVFTFVSVAFALFCAVFFCTFSVKALATLLTLAFAEVRSFGEFDAGDTHLRTDCTVIEEELTGKVACGAVRRYDEVFTILERCECLLEVISCSALSCVYNACLVVCIIVLAVCTVIDADNLTVLIENECFTPTVGPVESALICRGVNYKQITAQNRKVLVNRDLFGKEIIGLVVDGNLYKVVNNFNHASNGSGVFAVGCGKCDGVGANSIDVEAAVIGNGNFNCNIIGRIEGAVIIGDSETAEDSSCKIEFGIGQVSKNLVVVTCDNGSLVYVRSENLLGICPKETNNVTVLVNYVVVHKAAAVGVNGGAAVAVLNNDCIAACRNGEVLCKCTCNGNGFTVNLNRGYGACGSVGVCFVNELGVSTVTAFQYEAVCVDNCCYAVAAGDVEGDGSIGCVVEYAADCYIGGVVAGKGYIFLILEGKEIALPLVLTKSVCSYLESESGESLENGYRTGSGSSCAGFGNCHVGNGVGAFNVCIKSVVIFNDEVCFNVNGYAKHEVDLVACMNFKSCGNYADNRSSFTVVRGSRFRGCRGSRFAGGGFLVFVNRVEQIARCECKHKCHNSCNCHQNF